jgi:3',5'-cyclic AMP phosphodiesterase CpdA
MTRIVHISDLHFGRTRPELEAPLVHYINGLSPDVVAVSGDLTQRARHGQFADAARFLAKLKAQVLCVPGNHDMPLRNPFLRLLIPFARYRRHVAEQLEPCVDLPGAVVAGMNTADQRVWQRGRIRQSSLARTCAVFEQKAEGQFGVAVMHHPPEQEDTAKKTPMRGGAAGLQRLQDCGADIILCGHLHSSRIVPFQRAGGVLLVQAGTGLSSRLRGQPNDLNLLDLGQNEARIERHAAREGSTDFALVSRHHFHKPGPFWRSAG